MTATKQQPIAGYRISDPSDPTIKPWLSDTPDDNGYTSEPLYAGAAPAAVAGPAIDRAATLAAIDDISEPSWTGYECPNTWADGLSAARAVVQSAPAAPALEAPESHTQALRAIADWPVTDMLMNMDAANMRGIAQRALAAAPQAPAPAPGMAVTALAGEIIAALEADEKDGGYDLTSGLFGPKFSALVRRWAAAEWAHVTAPQAPAAPSAFATQVIENLLQLARIVNTAVEDWGETKEDDSMEVIFHKEEADKMEAILEFFDGLPDAPAEEGVIESGPLRAARVLRAQAAPAAPAVDAKPLFAQETELDAVVRDAEQIIRDAEHYRFIKRHRLILSGGTDTFGWPIAPFGDECDRYIAQELATERAAQAKEGGE